MTRACFIAALLLAHVAAAQRPPSPPTTYRIAGVVIDALNGAPLAGADVSLQPVAEGGQQRDTACSSDGRFEFANLAPGKYSLSARHRGYPPQFFEQHESFSTAIVVGPELASDNIVFRLHPDASISGRITDEHNEAVREAQVILMRAGVIEGRESTRRAAMATSDDLGQYHFDHVQAGTYFVAVFARPWYAQAASMYDRPQAPENVRELSLLNVAYPLTYYSQASEIGDADPLLIRPGDRVSADIALHPVPALTVRLPVDNSQGRVQPTLLLSLPDGGNLGAPGPIVTRDNNSVEIEGVAPGHYSLMLRSRGEHNFDPFAEQELDVASDMDVTPQAPQSAPRVSGTVRFDGAAWQRCFVRLRNQHSHLDYVSEVQPSGEFSFRRTPPAGEYEVYVSGADDFYVKSLSASGAKAGARRLTLGASDAVTLTVTLGRGIGRIDGVARKADKPLAGAMILLLPQNWEQNSGLIRRDQSDSDGSFTLPNVVPGNYLVLAIEKGWDLEWQRPAVLQPFLASAQRVQVAPGGTYKVGATVPSAATSR